MKDSSRRLLHFPGAPRASAEAGENFTRTSVAVLEQAAPGFEPTHRQALSRNQTIVTGHLGSASRKDWP